MIRNARMEDVQEIYNLLRFYSEKDLLLGRSLSSLYDQLRDFKVVIAKGDELDLLEHYGNKVIGVGSLHVCWENLAEIRSLAIAEPFHGKGIGNNIVTACLEEANELGITKVFTLTYQPAFFEKLGFKPVDKSELPHKVWSDCLQCHKFPDCNEDALIWENTDVKPHQETK